MSRFGLSPQQASDDIAQYLALAPANAEYETATKTYVRTSSYAPLVTVDPFVWMQKGAEEGDKAVLPHVRLPLPSRRMDVHVVRALIAAYESRRALAIRYQSLSSEAPRRRIICPHHVIDTNDRVHVRAWDDERKIFADFVLSRILSAEPEPVYPWVDGIADTMWNETVGVRLAPHPELSLSQRSVVEREHDMEGGNSVVEVRKALVTYLLDALGLLEAVRGGSGIPERARATCCVNPGELKPYVPA